ncbi:MAG: hypothetical protein PHR19_06300 [Bacteroidales bacterium]|nr:hypothetical protein [Bacteroidales bacterium]
MMKNLKNLLFISLVALLVASCGFGKMVPKSQVQMKLENQDLENKGGKVEYTVKGTVPPKFLKKRASMDIQVPVLMIDADGTTKEVIKTVKIVGQKSKEEGVRIPYKTGGSFTVSGSFDFKEEYEDQGIYALQTANLRKKSFTYEPVLITEGISNTASRISLTPVLSETPGSGTTLLFAPHNYKPEYITQEGTIYFEVDRANLNWNLKLNRDAQAKQIVKDFIAFMEQALADNRVVDKVVITGWASPEGEESRNQGLSERRLEEGKKWFEGELKKWQRSYARKNKLRVRDVQLPEFVFENNANGEDWMGFQAAVEKSNIAERNKIMNVVQSQETSAMKEQRIREMTDIYPEIAELILPPLRRVEIKMICNKNLFNEQQIPEVVLSNPEQLSLNERLYGASQIKDLETKTKVYNDIIQNSELQSDWRAYNNLAAIELNEFLKDGNPAHLVKSTDLLNKAAATSPNNGIILNNMAITHFLSGDVQSARNTFQKSAKATVHPVKQDYNLGMFKILDGDYAAAQEAMGNRSCDYSVALAQLLAKNYGAAKSNLDCINPKNAEVYYLLAVVAARTQVEQDVYKNLELAVQQDPTLKAKAKKDAEFKRYKNNERFINIVK